MSDPMDKLLMNKNAIQKIVKPQKESVDTNVKNLKSIVCEHVALVEQVPGIEKNEIDDYALHLEQSLNDIFKAYFTLNNR